jgi:putative protease
MRYAFAYGADAVYAGQPRYSLRVRNNEFKALDNLALGIEEAHAQGKQFYIASNIAAHNDKVRSYLRDLEPIVEMRPDALIMSDPGLIMLVRERWPELPVHLSVQANAVNYAAVKFWQQMGLSRVILSRELSLEEIEEIRQQVPDMELEVFVHGALCIAYSGRCLLSGYMTHRDANQGACTNSCRWQYNAHQATENEVGELIATDGSALSGNDVGQWQPDGDSPAFLLQEQGRPGELMPAYEDEHGTYIMNSKDLRAVQHVKRLTEMGVHSLKIEGRTKSHYYVARTAQIYRKAIDDAAAGREFDMAYMDELETLSNRGYTEGFYRRHPPAEYQQYERGEVKTPGQQFVGEVIDSGSDRLTIEVKNRFAEGDTMELMMPGGGAFFTLEGLQNQAGQRVDVAPGSGHIVTLPKPAGINEADLPYALLVRRFA